MPSKQKAKGSGWEREVARYLSDLYGESFIRAPGSGAYIGASNQKRKQYLHEGQIRNFKGDIVPGQSFPKLNVECKNYGEFPLHLLFSEEVKQFESWLDQLMCVADANDFSILLMKITRKATLAASNNNTLKYSNYFTYKSKNYGTWYIMDFNTFWQVNKDQVKILCG